VRLRSNILAMLLGLVLSLGLLEAVLRVFPYAATPPSLSRELDWRAAHRTTQEILTKASRPFDTHSPELGWELKPNLRADGLTSNSKGLRGTREYDAEPPEGVRRVLCVGDSFMFGENLGDEETLPAQLETVLNRDGRWEVLNLGVHGYGTDQQWLRLKHVGFEYTAHVVVLGFFEDNLRRNIMSFRDYAKPYFELVEGGLVLRNTPVPSPEELLSRPPEWPSCLLRLWCILQGIAENLAIAFPKVPDLDHTRAGQVTLAILDTMRETSLSRGMQLVLVTFPRRIRPRPSKTEALLLRWAAHTGTPLLNLRQAYLGLPANDQVRLYAGHWTAYATAITAQLLADKVREVAPAVR